MARCAAQHAALRRGRAQPVARSAAGGRLLCRRLHVRPRLARPLPSPQVTCHQLQCIVEHLRFTKGAPPAPGAAPAAAYGGARRDRTPKLAPALPLRPAFCAAAAAVAHAPACVRLRRPGSAGHLRTSPCGRLRARDCASVRPPRALTSRAWHAALRRGRRRFHARSGCWRATARRCAPSSSLNLLLTAPHALTPRGAHAAPSAPRGLAVLSSRVVQRCCAACLRHRRRGRVGQYLPEPLLVGGRRNRSQQDFLVASLPVAAGGAGGQELTAAILAICRAPAARATPNGMNLPAVGASPPPHVGTAA
jgi:hypothetical protein